MYAGALGTQVRQTANEDTLFTSEVNVEEMEKGGGTMSPNPVVCFQLPPRTEALRVRVTSRTKRDNRKQSHRGPVSPESRTNHDKCVPVYRGRQCE